MKPYKEIEMKLNRDRFEIFAKEQGYKDGVELFETLGYSADEYEYWCNGDKEQMLRIFATSGLFRPNKSADYYEHTAIKALREIPVKSTYTPTVPKNTGSNGKR